MSWKQEFYPSPAEVDAWCAPLLDEAAGGADDMIASQPKGGR